MRLDVPLPAARLTAKIGVLVFVMLSVLDFPVSLAAVRFGADGAGAAVPFHENVVDRLLVGWFPAWSRMPAALTVTVYVPLTVSVGRMRLMALVPEP